MIPAMNIVAWGRTDTNVRGRADHRPKLLLSKPALERAQTDPGGVGSLLLRTRGTEHIGSDLALFECRSHTPIF